MEVLVFQDTKVVEASIAIEDDGTAMNWKEKKRRRVSFAHTDTVHVIPRNDDLQTPPLLNNTDPLSIIHNTPLPSELSIAGDPASQLAIHGLSVADPDLHLGSQLHENSADFSHFTCDMDTSHGSWDEDSTTRRNSFDESGDDSGCFVHLRHISGLEDDGSIVNDVMNDDMTMDATTFSRNLSYYLKSGTKSDSEGTGPLGQMALHKNANDTDSRTDDDSMALTKPGAPHWALVHPQDVSLRADDDQSDMSLATGTVLNTTVPTCNLQDVQVVQIDHTITRKQSREVVPTGKILESRPQDVSLHSDDDQSDMSLATGTVFNTTVPMCNLKDLLLDQTDHTITRKQSREVVSTGKILESRNFGPDSIQSHSHSNHGHSDPQSSDCGLGSPLSKKEVILENTQDVSLHADDQTDMSLATGTIFNSSPLSKKEVILEIAQDVSLYADDDQTDMGSATGTIFNTTVPMCNLKDLLDQTDHTITSKQLREVVSTDKILEHHNFGPDTTQSHSHSKHGHSGSQSSDYGGLGSTPSEMELIVENVQKAKSAKADQSSFIRDTTKSKSTDAESAAGKEAIEEVATVVQQASQKSNAKQQRSGIEKHAVKVSSNSNIIVSSLKIRTTMSNKVSAGVGISGAIGRDPSTKGLRGLKDMLQCIKGKTLHGEDQGGEEDMVPQLPTKLETLGDYLQFSCTVQPQIDSLREHVQELEAKLQAAKKRNAEIKSSNIFVQKLLEESTLSFKAKFASMQSLAKKRWLLWKMKPERQILAWLQENKDNLIKESEAVHGKGQQVLHLKESYSQIVLYHHHYQDASERLRISKDKWNKMHTHIQSIASVYGHKVQSAADSSFEKNLEAVIRRLFFTNSVLQQQQVMQSTLKSNGGKSLIDFSLDGMCSQSFQFQGGGPLAQVEVLRNLHPEAIEMTFPCMNASLVFQYINSDLHSNTSVQMQHVYQIIQHTNYLFGCLMDVLKELRYCQRKFRISCKFQIQEDKLLLNATFLQGVSGLKVTLIFDTVFVKSGMYPSDLKPADIQIEMFSCTSKGSMTRREVLARIANIEPGFARFYRICSCVDELMRAVKESD